MNTMTFELETEVNDQVTEFLNYLLENGGPNPEDYTKFTSIVDNLDPSEVDNFRDKIKSVLNENTLIGHGFVKPYGYSGDFHLIDKIYQFDVNEDSRYKNWDLFFQNQAGANAVRNRKDFFIKYCKDLVINKENPKVLILGSGPASDVYEFLNNYSGSNNISFDLIDYDQAAIDFSMKKNQKFNGHVSYNRINALRYNSFKLYDLIWSAGMFDYFKDKHFTFLIRKYINCLAEDGEMVISNFSTRNPTKRLMEVLSDWYLNLRTESDLFRIALDACVDKELVSIDKEPLGVNLFLKVRKN
ncbi:regulatory protein [sediment metagenome]|uniref:Regulatory protein n=1 Tax=sediment metagenome TaxID=749907 RepID=D9PFI3_9ZZZZ